MPRDFVFSIKQTMANLFPANKQPLVAPVSVYDAMHKVFDGSYTFIDTTQRQPTPGAEAFAFAQLMLPLLDWKGPGDIVQRNMQITSKQLYVAQSVTPTGLAGIAAGQTFAGNLQMQDLSG